MTTWTINLLVTVVWLLVFAAAALQSQTQLYCIINSVLVGVMLRNIWVAMNDWPLRKTTVTVRDGWVRVSGNRKMVQEAIDNLSSKESGIPWMGYPL